LFFSAWLNSGALLQGRGTPLDLVIRNAMRQSPCLIPRANLLCSSLVKWML